MMTKQGGDKVASCTEWGQMEMATEAKMASCCIGDYGGTVVDAGEKRKIETQIGQFYPDRSVRQMLSIGMVAAGVCFFVVTFHFMPRLEMWIFFALSLVLLVGGIFVWGFGGCILYASWKNAEKTGIPENTVSLSWERN